MSRKSGYHLRFIPPLTSRGSTFVVDKDDSLPKSMLSLIPFPELTGAEFDSIVEKGHLRAVRSKVPAHFTSLQVIQRLEAQYATTTDVRISRIPS